MPRTKIMKQPKRFNAVVDNDTYTSLITLTGRQTMIEGRPVSLAEYVRVILEDAVNRIENNRGTDPTALNSNVQLANDKTNGAAQRRLVVHCGQDE